MDFLCSDLEVMIMERAKGEDLSRISRVKKSWRGIIANNPRRMRSVRCNHLDIIFDLQADDSLTIGVTFPYYCTRQYPFPFHCLLKFLPDYSIVLPRIAVSTPKVIREIIEKEINSIPQWWIHRIRRVSVEIHNVLFYDFTTKVKHISHLIFRNIFGPDLREVEEMMNLIRNCQQVDKFHFHYCYSLAPIIDAIIEHSQKYPTKIPKFGESEIRAEDFIRFLENTRFLEVPCLNGQVRIAKRTGMGITAFNRWMENNAIVTDVQYNKIKFIYRGRTFNIVVLYDL